MLCCVASILTMATLPAWRNRFRKALGVLGIGAIAAMLSVPIGLHLGHYQARAAESGRDLLAEILAQPLCTGAPPPAMTAKREISTLL